MVDHGTILALALAGHLIGDWLVQSDWQAANKVWPLTPPALSHEMRELEADDDDGEGWVIGPLPVPTRPWLRSWRANQQHMLGYHAALTVCVAPVWHDRWALAALAVSWASHSLIDRRWPVRWLMRHTGSAPFAETTWGVIAVDQALHVAILALLAAWA